MTHYLERSLVVRTVIFGIQTTNLVLLEFKCSFKREIAKNRNPSYYSDQIQTGLALSGESVNKGLFVDSCFRICSLRQIECFHKNVRKLKNTINEEREKPTIIENKGDDKEFLEAFFHEYNGVLFSLICIL